MTSLMLLSLLTAGASGAPAAGPVEPVADGFQFTEGPLWLSGPGVLIFSDIPANTIFRADKSVFREPSGKSNGLTLDPQGRLIACEHGNRRVSRTEQDGTVLTVVDTYEGKKLNSPNDACVRSDGTIFFTDPPYGLEGREQELAFSGVYAVSPDGKLTLLKDDFQRPNGIALSPDESVLYVADTERGHIRAFDVNAAAEVSNEREYCQVPGPDGIKVDTEGNVWATARDGVRVYNPQGELLGTVELPEVPANCAFGEADGKTLYITARKGLYKVPTTIAGIVPPAK